MPASMAAAGGNRNGSVAQAQRLGGVADEVAEVYRTALW
jgi:hypothetical protein